MSTLKLENIQHPDSSTPAISLDSNGAMSGAIPAGGRNKIINGEFLVWQRGTSFSVSGWQADRFNSNMGTVSRSTDVPEGFVYSFSSSSAGTPLLQTSVELPATGVKGSLTGQHTMSFYAKFDAGATMYFASWFADSTGGGNQVTVVNYNGSTTPSFVGTGNWERYSFTFDISQTPLSSNTCLRFTWLNLNAGFTLNNFKITGVQLEKSPVATPFEHRSFGDELARCQRYYQKSYNYEDAPGTVTGNGIMVTIGMANSATTTGNNNAGFLFPTRMRAAPTVTVYRYDNGASGSLLYARHSTPAAPAAATVFRAQESGASIGTTAASSLTTGYAVEIIFHYTADAEL